MLTPGQKKFRPERITMNYYVQEGLISEVKGHDSTGYILSSNDLFFLTEYKVLKSHEKSGFVKCSRLMYNGKQKLLYYTADYKSLISMLPSLDIDGFLTIIANIFKNLIDINNIGFLRCKNIDCSFDKIFVDPNTLSVYMIYLPISADGADKLAGNVENDLRTDLIKLINTHPALNSSKTYKLCQVLANGTKSTSEIYAFILRECLGRSVPNTASDLRGERRQKTEEQLGKRTEAGTDGSLPPVRLIAQHTNEYLEFTVTKSPYVLGRSETYADGVISINKAIGRTHCQILYKNGSHFVVDLKSSNGTKINGQRLNPEQAYLLRDGDVLRLANLDFLVRI